MIDRHNGEIWKPLPEYESLYNVSDFGRVMRVGGRLGDMILKGFPKTSGYMAVTISRYGTPQRQFYIHRLVARAFLGTPNGKHVNHKNGNRSDNRLENLEYVTRSENVQHAMRVLGAKFGSPPGDNHPLSKLSLCEVDSIRNLSKHGIKHTALAKKFHVSDSLISMIVKQKRRSNAF